MSRNHREHHIQSACVQFLERAAPADLIWFAVPNGGHRNKITASMMKAEGVKPGIADMIFCRQGRTLFGECKTPEGTMSKHQKAFSDLCKINGFEYFVFRSVNDLEQHLRRYGIPLTGTTGTKHD